MSGWQIRSMVAVGGILVTLTGFPAWAEDIIAKSTISAVTVYTRAAEVSRTTDVTLPAGEHAVVFGDLPARIMRDSIRIEGDASGDLEIGAVDTKSILLPEEASASAERKRLEQEIEKLGDRAAEISDRIATAEQRKALIRNLAQLPVQPAPQGQAQGARTPADWAALSDLIGTQLADANQEVRSARLASRDVEKQITDLQRKLAGVAPRRIRRSEVRVNVVAGAALNAKLTIRYQVADAGWSPVYEARLATGDKETKPDLKLTRRARVYQSTGETWRDVQLALSTTRPGQGTAAPRVETLRAEFQPESALRKYSSKSVTTAQQAPEAPTMQLEMDEAAPQARGITAAPKRKKLSRRKARVQAAAFQARYVIPGRHTITDDGTTRNIEIDRIAFAPVLTIRSVPRKRAAAFLYADVKVADGERLLPGAVALFRDGIFVGRGRLPTLTSGEEHELGFGEDDTVRVEHITIAQKTGESGIISTSKTDTRQFRMTVINGHKRTVKIRVLDQLPVSGDDDIQVVMVGNVTAPTVNGVDEKPGVLAWDFDLAPQAQRVINFGYRVTWPGGKNIRFREVRSKKRKSR